MRLAFLKSHPTRGVPVYRTPLVPCPPAWVLLTSRLTPNSRPLSDSGIALLDKGFFFPAVGPWVRPTAPYRGFVLSTRGAASTVPPQEKKHKALLWELVEGLNAQGTPLNVNLNRFKVRPDLSPTPLCYPTGLLSMYSGIRHTRYDGSSLVTLRNKKGLVQLPTTANQAASTQPTNLAPTSPLVIPLNLAKPLAYRMAQPLATRSAALKATQLAFGNPNLFFVKPRVARMRQRELVRPLPQTRYKPGLSKAWRLLRLQFCLSWGLPWLRQRRFTNYVSQVTNLTGTNFIRMCLFSVGGLAATSGLLILESGLADLVFLNGVRVANPLLQVYKGDRIMATKDAIGRGTRLYGLTQTLTLLPVAGIEVDGLARSLTLITDPSGYERGQAALARPLPFLTFRMYNWKYRH